MQPHTPRILCIDDNSDSCELIRLILQHSNADYHITCVSTPIEGLSLAATRRFDLYLLDYRLTGISGVEVCRTLRQTYIDTPIMFFTAEAHGRERQEAMRAGADAYLVKPNDLKKLTETVKRLLATPKSAVKTRGASLESHGLFFERQLPLIL